MTTERKRAIWLMIATFFIGILIGVLGSGLIRRQMRKAPMAWRQDGKEMFINRLMKIAGADSAQAKQIKPIMLESIARIDSLQKSTDKGVRAVIDSLEIKLKPILTEKQLNQLKEYHRRGRAMREERESRAPRNRSGQH